MVDYSKWISIVRTEAASQGAELSDFEENSNIVSVGAEIWNDRKQELKNATGREAENIAQEEISVQ
jgi:hypothetical protein